jgi:RecQ family ATP-dependent DNA helicase
MSEQDQKYKATLKSVFGYDNFRDKQLEIIKTILDGRDVCAIMFTGAGKSLCFQFPAICTDKLSIVISPLISLMNDQCIKMLQAGVPACCINSEMEYSEKCKVLQEVKENKYRLLYTTPEYLIKQKALVTRLHKDEILLLVAVDEAHCCSSWGNDFRMDYKKLSCLKEWCPSLPIITLTATATEIVQNDIIDTLQLVNPLIVKTTFNRDNLFISVRTKSDDPLEDIVPLIVEENNKPVIIYCGTRSNTESINELLKQNGIICDSYHAGMDPKDKSNVHNKFIRNEIDCVVATVAFGMGIDKPIRTVVHYCVPMDLESYYQEIGRAGRDGILANCIMFKSNKDLQIDHYIINKIEDETFRDYKMSLLASVKRFISTTGCRRKMILGYFGEDYDTPCCGLCDNCCTDSPKITVDFSDNAKLLLAVVRATGNSYGAGMICNILRGSKSSQILKKHTQINEYGKGKNMKLEWWKSFIDLLVNHGYLKQYTITGGRGCILTLTDEGTRWLRKGTDSMILPVPEELKKYHPQVTIRPNTCLTTIPEPSNDDIEKSIIEHKYTDTVRMFNEGTTIDQIAKTANVKTITIENHLVKAYEQGMSIDFSKINLTEDIIDTIKNIIDKEGSNATLSTIKKLLPKNINYLQIKLVKTSTLITKDANIKSKDCNIKKVGKTIKTRKCKERKPLYADDNNIFDSDEDTTTEIVDEEVWEEYDPASFDTHEDLQQSNNEPDVNVKIEYQELFERLKKNLDKKKFSLESCNTTGEETEEIFYESE